MSHFYSLLIAAVLFLLIPSLPVLASVAPYSTFGEAAAAPGITYMFRGTDEKGSVEGRGMVLGSVARFDIISMRGQPMPLAQRGHYMILDGRTGLLTIVDPDSRQYSQLPMTDVGKMAAMAAGLANAMLNFTVSGLDVKTERLGSGGSVSGYATQKYRMTVRYQATANALGVQSRMSAEDTYTFWVAPERRDLLNPFSELARILTASVRGGGGSGMSEVLRQVDAAQRTLLDGMPLRTETRSVAVHDGERTVTTSTSEFYDIKSQDIPPSALQPPANFKKVDPMGDRPPKP
jgi:hypothetical protein